MHEAARPDMLEVEWIADWIGNHPGLIERTKRNWKRSELIKRILNHDHGTSQRLDDICEACASERIHRLNGTSIQNPQSGSSIGNPMTPRSSIRLALSSGISFLSNGTAHENPPVSLHPSPEPLSGSIEVLSRVGDLQEIIDWMDEGPGFSSPSFECWPRLKSFTIGVHINYTNKTVWAWKRKSAVAVQQELRPEIGFKAELTSNNMGHLLWWRD
ncbi:hypothetical protein BGX20_008649 [Mortierella sp. AD010]|nr:hypothetical protein BGX20_008649 [Mortierella sp. AD010]